MDLPRALVVPVRLILVYTDLENPTQRNKRITNAAYINTTVIRHLEFSSQVAFDHFIVEVGLFSQDVRGPLIRAPGEYSKSASYSVIYHTLSYFTSKFLYT